MLNLGYDRMNLWVTRGTINGADLAAGDEIGLFDGERCVGAGVVEAAPSDENHLTILASKDDGSGNGFAEGNGITFRVWDSSEGVETADVGSVYFDLAGNAIAPPEFTGNGDYITHLEAVSEAGANPLGKTISLDRRNSVGLTEEGTAIVAVQGRDRYGAAAGVEDWQDLKQVSAGYNFTAGLRNDGTVVATPGWDARVNRHTGRYMDATDWQNIEQIATGWAHILGLTTEGTLVVAGNGDLYRERRPVGGSVTASDFAWIAGSMRGVSARDIVRHLRKRGFLDETGSLTAIALDSGSYRDLDLPYNRRFQRYIFHILKRAVEFGYVDKIAQWNDGILNDGDSPFVMVAMGDRHFAALRADGTVVASGDDKRKKYHDGVETWENITRISAGVFHTVGLKGDGTIVATGKKGYRRADLDAWNASVAGGGNPFIQVSAGYLQTVALRADGTVAVSSRRETYDQVNNWTNIVEVSAGGSYVVGLTANDEVLVDIGNSDGVDDHIHGKPLSDWTSDVFFR
uniref:Alpha-tubulin suppressor n=1 Tax=Candidatus Kentrum sp. DK TaxID=2126562 RepID=A0A450TES3_9GAMM|nr:MAG: Alpha-tubulin suppressor [Candidatus Kentron sp. DK]